MTFVVKSLASSQPVVAATVLHHWGTSLRHPPQPGTVNVKLASKSAGQTLLVTSPRHFHAAGEKMNR